MSSEKPIVQAKKQKKYGDGRTRSWTFIVYPESAPLNWRDLIDEEHIQWVESPLHDMDVDANGEIKKSHWHILLLYESVKDIKQVEAITDKLNATMPQKCNGAKGLVRYMAHLDNPEKHQYSAGDIIGHCGVDIAELLKPTSAKRYELIAEMCDFVKMHQVTEYSDLLFYARDNRFDDWFPLLCDNCSLVMSNLIKSVRNRNLK